MFVVRRRWRFLPRNPLVVAQIAFSLALLTAAALFIRGANKAASLDTGLRVDNDLLLEVDASLGGVDQPRAEQLYRTLTDRLAALPGVQHVSISATAFGMPLAGLFKEPECIPADEKPPRRKGGIQFALQQRWRRLFWGGLLPLLRAAISPERATQPTSAAVAIIDEALAKKLCRTATPLVMDSIASDGAARGPDDGGGNGHSTAL